MENIVNKRKHFRAGCAVPVEAKPGDTFDHLQTVDFSKRGLGLISPREIPVGKTISIELNLNEYEDPVIVIGKIMWCRYDEASGHFKAGVDFVEILRGSKGHLDQYFKHHRPKRWS